MLGSLAGLRYMCDGYMSVALNRVNYLHIRLKNLREWDAVKLSW